MNRSIIIFSAALVISGCAGEHLEGDRGKPEIVYAFLCSDYCPEPEETYLKRVFDGVTDESECQELGGRSYTYSGWGQRTVCIAE